MRNLRYVAHARHKKEGNRYPAESTIPLPPFVKNPAILSGAPPDLQDAGMEIGEAVGVEGRDEYDAFLVVLARYPNVKFAGLMAGLPLDDLFKRKAEDPDFSQRWDQAISTSIDMLEVIAWQRARFMSDKILMFLLRSHRPDIYAPDLQMKKETHQRKLELMQMTMQAHVMRKEKMERVAETKMAPLSAPEPPPTPTAQLEPPKTKEQIRSDLAKLLGCDIKDIPED